MTKTMWLMILCCAITGSLQAKEYLLNSPGANNQIRINCGSEIGFTLWNKLSQVLSVNTIFDLLPAVKYTGKPATVESIF